jgi:hypothetical protein
MREEFGVVGILNTQIERHEFGNVDTQRDYIGMSCMRCLVMGYQIGRLLGSVCTL